MHLFTYVLLMIVASCFFYVAFIQTAQKIKKDDGSDTELTYKRLFRAALICFSACAGLLLQSYFEMFSYELFSYERNTLLVGLFFNGGIMLTVTMIDT